MLAGPRYQTKTDRRSWRQSVRNALGTSSEGPPSFGQLRTAVTLLDRLMRWTTNSKFGVDITGGEGSYTTQPSREELDRYESEWSEV